MPAKAPVNAGEKTRASEDFIAFPFERWHVLGCVYELLLRDHRWEATLVDRRIRGWPSAAAAAG